MLADEKLSIAEKLLRDDLLTAGDAFWWGSNPGLQVSFLQG